MTAYTVAADAVVASLCGCAPPGVTEVFDRAATGAVAAEATPGAVARVAAAFHPDRDVPGCPAWLARAAADTPHDARSAVRTALNGPVTVPRVGAATLVRLGGPLADHDPTRATVVAASDTRATAGIVTSDPVIRRRRPDRVVWG